MIDVVIPVRPTSYPYLTLCSLGQQTYRDFRTIVQYDDVGNANWARNQGFKSVTAPFVLFADDDIEFNIQALEWLKESLDQHPTAAYSYGSFLWGDRLVGDMPFNAGRLRKQNYISTMSLIRTAVFPGFDESLQRLQDWDLWLQLLAKGYEGVQCNKIVFRTAIRNGITRGGPVSIETAKGIVRKKHQL